MNKKICLFSFKWRGDRSVLVRYPKSRKRVLKDPCNPPSKWFISSLPAYTEGALLLLDEQGRIEHFEMFDYRLDYDLKNYGANDWYAKFEAQLEAKKIADVLDERLGQPENELLPLKKKGVRL